MKQKQFSIQEAVQPRHTVYDLHEFEKEDEPIEFEPCKSVRFNTGGTYKVYFAARPTVAIAQTYYDGDIEESQIIMITDTDDALVDAGAVFIYY